VSWWKSSIQATQLLSLDPGSDTGELLFVAPPGNDGKVWRMEYGTTDDGQAINSHYATPHHDMQSPDTVKVFHQFGADVDEIGGGIQVTWNVDFGKAYGTIILSRPGKYQWGDSSVAVHRWRWNNAAGTTQRGMRWTTRKKGEYIVNLPAQARGRTIQVLMENVSGLGMKVVAHHILFTREESTEPGSEAKNG